MRKPSRTEHSNAAAAQLRHLRRLALWAGSAAFTASLVACGGSTDADAVADGRQQTLALTQAEMAGTANLSGAIYTTTKTPDTECGEVNANQFDSKDDVYLNGGPQGGGSGLPDGNYWVMVTEPDGTVLGKSITATAKVVGGKFEVCYLLKDIVNSASSNFATAGYDDTTNGGGVYKVWVSTTDQFKPSESKTDNFKVKGSGTEDLTGTLVVEKFYDSNANGTKDSGEMLLQGWRVGVTYGNASTIESTTYTNALAALGLWSATEALPTQANWKPTTATTLDGVVEKAKTTTLSFGNVCLAGGNGRTLGFWSNRNGQALVDSADLAALRALNLKNANGTDFEPTTGLQLRNWLLSATATNMANMLSAQLAAMTLSSREPGYVAPTAIIYAPGTASANAAGFATVTAVMAEANDLLRLDSSTPSGDANRAQQERLKNVLDSGNNNLNWVLPVWNPTLCPYTF